MLVEILRALRLTPTPALKWRGLRGHTGLSKCTAPPLLALRCLTNLLTDCHHDQNMNFLSGFGFSQACSLVKALKVIWVQHCDGNSLKRPSIAQCVTYKSQYLLWCQQKGHNHSHTKLCFIFYISRKANESHSNYGNMKTPLLTFSSFSVIIMLIYSPLSLLLVLILSKF